MNQLPAIALKLLVAVSLAAYAVRGYGLEQGSTGGEPATFTVSGKLLGPDNKAPEWSAIKIESYQLKTPVVEKVEYLPSSGEFDIALNGEKVHSLKFTSPHHEPLTIWFGALPGKDLSFDIHLDTRRFTTNPDSVGLALLNEEKPQRHDLTQTREDEFGFSTELEAGEIKYELTGIGLASRGVVDPGADKYELDERGRWVGYKIHPGGKAAFAYKVPEQESFKAKQRIRFAGSWNEKIKANMLVQASMQQLTYDKDYFGKLHKDSSVKYEAGISRIQAMLDKYPGDEAQQLIYLIASGLFNEPSIYHEEAVKRVPATSWKWMIGRASYIESLAVATQGYDEDKIWKNVELTYAQEGDKIVEHLENWHSRDKTGAGYWRLAYVFKAVGNSELYEKYYQIFTTEFTDVYGFEALGSAIGKNKVEVGTVFPEFRVASISGNGDVYTNESFKGRYVLYDFWGSWCPPCIKELPALEQAYAKYHDLGFDILGFNADETVDAFHEFRKGKWEMPWKHTFIGLDDEETREYYGVFVFPTAYLVDPEGVIVATGEQVKGSNLGPLLDELLVKADASSDDSP